MDYAEETVAIIKENFPELDIIYGDVRKLPFADNEFDGYWSFGVIEHFFNGYKDIAEEMKRVVKVGGYLFITFPHMSVLRRLKVILRQYPFFNLNEVDISNFYQFALDEKKVISYFNQIGFELKDIRYLDATKGLKDEIKLLRPFLQFLYNSKRNPIVLFRLILSAVFSRVSSHVILLVLRKTSIVSK